MMKWISGVGWANTLLVIIILIQFSFSSPAYGLPKIAGWTIVREGTDYSINYLDIQFVGKRGWIVGWDWNSGGIILHSADGGNSWIEHIYKDSVEYGFRSIHFQNENEGWIISGGGFDFSKFISNENYIFHTTDGGNTWMPVEFQIVNDPFKGFLDWGILRDKKSIVLSDVYFVNHDEGWLIGGPDVLIGSNRLYLFHSLDAGKTWVGRHFPHILKEVYFTNPRDGWLLAESTNPLQTADGGDTWEPIRLRAEFSFYFIQFISQDGWIIESHGNVHHSSDGGRTWRLLGVIGLKPLEYVYGGSFISPAEGWVVSDRGRIAHTTDGGKGWQIIFDGDLVVNSGIRLYKIEYVSFTGEIWALGRGAQFEPYILKHSLTSASVNPAGKVIKTWGRLKANHREHQN